MKTVDSMKTRWWSPFSHGVPLETRFASDTKQGTGVQKTGLCDGRSQIKRFDFFPEICTPRADYIFADITFFFFKLLVF